MDWLVTLFGALLALSIGFRILGDAFELIIKVVG